MAKLNRTTYTKINTSNTDYLIQNTSSDTIRFVVTSTDSQPASSEVATGALSPDCGISNNNTEGFVWGKCTVFAELDIFPIKG